MMIFDPRAWCRTGAYCVLLLALAALGCGERELSLAEQLAEIDKNWQAGNVSAALITLKNAVRVQPDDAALRRRLAEFYIRLGNPEAAQAEIEKASKSGLDARSVELLNIRLALLRNQADVALAKFETEATIAADPTLKALHAEILGVAGKLDAAQALYAEALNDLQPPAAAYQGMARILVVRDDLKPARDLLNKAIAADSANWNNYMFDADLREREKDIDGARKSLHKAAQLNPFVIFPALAEVRLDLTQDKFDDAKQVLASLEKRAGKDPSVAYYRGMTAYAAGDFAVAEDSFRQVLSFAPNHPQSQLYMGYLLYRKGSLEQAENFLSVYHQLVPSFEPAQKVLASIQLKRLKPAEALQTLGELGADSDAELLGLRASALFAMGKAEAGLQSLQAAAQRSPQDQSIKTALAFATARIGKVDDAIAMLAPDAPLDKQLTQKDTMLLYLYMTRKEWDKVIEVGEKMRSDKGDDPALLNALASAYMGKENLAKAVELLKLAVAASPKTPTLLSNLALLLMRQGDIASGRQYIQQLLKIDSTDGANLTLAGAAADAGGDTAAAIEYYEKARAGNPKATAARLSLSSLYARMQNYDKTVELANEVLALLPGHLGATLDLGHGLRGQSKLAMAEKVARSALAIAPDSPKAQFLLGTIFLEGHQFSQAEVELNRARAGMPESPEVVIALIKALIGKGNATDLGTAQSMIEGLGQGQQESAAVSALRGELATAKGDHEAAAALFKAALKKDDRDGWAFKQAMALLRGGHTDAAVELLTARSSANTRSSDATLMLAQVLQQLGRDKEAVAAYEKILAANPGQILALNNLALLELRLGLPGALEHAKAAYDLNSENPQVTDTYGWILFKLGKTEVALQMLKFAADGAPADGSIQYHYATALVSQGNSREAGVALKRALSAADFPERKAAQQLVGELKR